MTTVLDEIQEKLKMMEKRRTNRLRRSKMSTEGVQRCFFKLQSATPDYLSQYLNGNDSIDKSSFQVSVETPLSQDFLDPAADYLNFSEIIRLRNEWSRTQTCDSNINKNSSITTTDSNKNNNSINNMQTDSNDHLEYEQSDRQRFIFDDIPQEILGMVDDLIASGKDIKHHFNAIDELAFNSKLLRSNYFDKEHESDTDSGNGTLQTENGSLSSQTLHDVVPEPPQKHPDDRFSPEDQLPLSEQLIHFLDHVTPGHDISNIPESTYSQPQKVEHASALPTSEIPTASQLESTRRQYVKGANARKGALKKGPPKTSEVLEKIPGTYLSQSCIDLSQIGPKRRVTFADEISTSIPGSSRWTEDDREVETKVEAAEQSNATRLSNETKGKYFGVFKFLLKKQQNESKEPESKSKKKAEADRNNLQFEDRFEDQFDDFDDFSSDEESHYEFYDRSGKDDEVFYATLGKETPAGGSTADRSLKAEYFDEEGYFVPSNFSSNVYKPKNKETHRVSLDAIIKHFAKQSRNSTPDISSHVIQQKKASIYNPLKNLKLKFRQLRGKNENSKKCKSNKQKPSTGDVTSSSMEDIKKDMDEALMDSDEECAISSSVYQNEQKERPTTFSYYHPTPFSKQSPANDGAIRGINSGTLKSPKISANFSDSVPIPDRSQQNQMKFETFLDPCKLKSVNQMSCEYRTADPTRVQDKIPCPKVLTPTRLKASAGEEENNLSAEPFKSRQPSSDLKLGNRNSRKSVKEVEYFSSVEKPLKEDSTDDHPVIDDNGELYLNHADMQLMVHHTTNPSILEDAGNEERTSFASGITIPRRTKPPILKPKPRLEELNAAKANAVKLQQGLKVIESKLLQDNSLEKMMKCYSATEDIKFMKATSWCDKLYKHLGLILRTTSVQAASGNILKPEAITKSLQKMKILCFSLVSSGKSMLIASTELKSTLRGRVTKSVHNLADFSLETKRFGLTTNADVDFKNFVEQFAKVVNRFKSTIEASDDLLRVSDEVDSRMGNLLELANLMAKDLADLLSMISSAHQSSISLCTL